MVDESNGHRIDSVRFSLHLQSIVLRFRSSLASDAEFDAGCCDFVNAKMVGEESAGLGCLKKSMFRCAGHGLVGTVLYASSQPNVTLPVPDFDYVSFVGATVQ